MCDVCVIIHDCMFLVSPSFDTLCFVCVAFQDILTYIFTIFKCIYFPRSYLAEAGTSIRVGAQTVDGYSKFFFIFQPLVKISELPLVT